MFDFPDISQETFQKTSAVAGPIATAERWTPPPSLANRLAYEKSIWVFIAVREISQAMATVPFVVGRWQGDAWVPLPRSRPNQLFENPNPFDTRYDLWEKLAVDLELSGNAYLEIVKDGAGRPVEIYPLRPDKVEIEPHPKNKIARYFYHINGKRLPVAGWGPDEIVHFRTANPFSEFYGFSPIRALDLSLQLDLYALKFNRNFFRRGARVSGVLETDYTLSDEAARRLEAQFQEAYAGWEAAFSVPILHSGLRFRSVKETHKEMEFIEQRREIRNEVFAAFGVYPAMAGYLETANYASAYVQKELFYVDTIIPKLTKIQERLNKDLIKQFGPEWEGRFLFDQIPALREKEETKAKVYAQYIEAGVLSPEEVREREGFGPIQQELFRPEQIKSPERIKHVIPRRKYVERPTSTNRQPIPIER